MNYLNDDGYPTDKYLEWLKEYNPFHSNGFSDMLSTFKYSYRYYEAGYFDIKRVYDGERTLWLHTGGWSGNESIIHALKQNIYFWMHWRMSKAGGHHKFRIPIDEFYIKD